MMTPERFNALCAAYGGDFERWPEAERDAGRAFAEAAPEPCEARTQALALDAALIRAEAGPVSNDLARRIAADAPRPRSIAAPAPAWAAMAAALALTVGLGVGWVGGGPGVSGDAELYADAFGALEDSAALALLEDA